MRLDRVGNTKRNIIVGELDRFLGIILPFIVSLTASLCCDFLIYIISRKFEKEKNLKVRMFVMNDNENNVSEIVIEGDTESVLKTLEIIKKDKLEK